MAARSMWRGVIQLGLLTIPVKLYSATEDREGIKFNMLCPTCLKRINLVTKCLEHGELKRTDTVKGYEYAPEQWVVMTEQDFESVPLGTKSAISVEQFIPQDAVVFPRGHYWLGPEPVGGKAYNLLRDTMSALSVNALAKVMIRERETLATISRFGDTLQLTTLYWPGEVRNPSDSVGLTDYTPQPPEMKMAAQLIKEMTAPFDPSAYQDEYKAALLSVIEAKIDGTAPTVAATPAAAPAPDIMAALMASMEAAKATKKGRGA